MPSLLLVLLAQAGCVRAWVSHHPCVPACLPGWDSLPVTPSIFPVNTVVFVKEEGRTGTAMVWESRER